MNKSDKKNSEYQMSEMERSTACNNPKRKVLSHDASFCLDGAEIEKIPWRKAAEPGSGYHVGGSFPDVVSESTSSQSQNSGDGCRDPDIVRSSSSSDEKSLETPMPSNKGVFKPPLDIAHGSTSSFSSSVSSSHSRSPSPKPHRGSRLPALSHFTSNERSDGHSHNDTLFRCIPMQHEPIFCYNQDSFFAQESEVFEEQQLCGFIPSASTVIKSSLPQSYRTDVSSEKPTLSEKGQKARNRFSSSGYGTGSAESSRGNSASKSSQLSQESFSRDVTATPQSTVSDTQNDTGAKNSENVTSRDITKHPALNDQASRTVELCTESEHAKPFSMNESRSDRSIMNNFQFAAGDKIKPGLNLLSGEVMNTPAAFSKPCNISLLEHQGAHNPYYQMNRSSPKVQKQSQTTIHKGDYQAAENNVYEHQHNFQQIFNSSLTLSSQSQQHPPSYAIGSRNSQAYADSPHHIWHSSPQHQHLLTGSPYNPSQISSSSGGSCFVSSSVEEKWSADPSPVSIAKFLLLQSGTASESSGESQYHLDSLLKILNQGNTTLNLTETEDQAHSDPTNGMPKFDELLSSSMSDLSSVMASSAESHFDKELWLKLQRSVRCNDPDCNVEDCMQIRKDLAVLYDERNEVSSLCESLKSLLLTVFTHMYSACDHPKCPFPWCGERVENIDNFSEEDRLKVMKLQMENFADHLTLPNSPTKYMKLTATLPHASVPLEGQAWVRMCMMGRSRRTLLVQTVSSEREYWVIKKVATSDDWNHWGLYSKLRDVRHRSVATFLWMASFEDHMLVCSLYEGISLDEYLPSLPPDQSVPVFTMMLQLATATTYLNNAGIIFLNWISKNILVTHQTRSEFTVKLCNFSCSALLDRYDGGYLHLALPRHICAPELRDKMEVKLVSDVWGIGCLLHELVTGFPVWHEHRHALDKEFASLTRGKPGIPTVYPELMDVFSACWEIDPRRRVSADNLEIMLIHAYRVHLKR